MLKKRNFLFFLILFTVSCSKPIQKKKTIITKKEIINPKPKPKPIKEDNKILTLIKKKLNQDYIVIILFISKKESARMARDPNDEIYPVWSSYFNQFAFKFSEESAIFHLTHEESKEIFNKDIPKSKYSSLFLKKNNYLYFPYPILKKNTYRGIEAVFNNRKISYRDFGIPPQRNKNIMKYLGITKISLDILDQ